jgi:hypothetical protein
VDTQEFRLSPSYQQKEELGYQTSGEKAVALHECRETFTSM